MCYAYNAATLCDDCADCIMRALDAVGAEDSGDTDDYPQYSHSDEADGPQHCDECNEFLGNDLTEDGRAYAERIIRDDIADGNVDSVAVRVWNDYYGLVSFSECVDCGKLAVLDDFYCCEECADHDS